MRRHSWERISQLFKRLVKNYEDFTLKQMFDVTAQLVNNQDESMAWTNSMGEVFFDTSVIDW